jgi:hypothetical protein
MNGPLQIKPYRFVEAFHLFKNATVLRIGGHHDRSADAMIIPPGPAGLKKRRSAQALFVAEKINKAGRILNNEKFSTFGKKKLLFPAIVMW